jgi:hypothetical protein
VRPNDENGRRTTAERPFRALVVAGSDRRQSNCPGVDSKARDTMRDAYAPLVWRCRFSGIEAPDALWSHALTGEGVACSDNQAEDMIREEPFLAAFDAWGERFTAFVARKGKVGPGPCRAFG